jgi:succinate dehydrogenase/fumarate reductase flavoprotein subunit
VLDHAGTPIPRLYEAGELGSTFGNLYQNGSFLTECIVFGRIAARNAIAEVPWGKKERRSQAKAS